MLELKRVGIGLMLSASWAAAAQTNVFINPSPLTGTFSQAIANLQTYDAGQVLDVSWTTNYPSVDLVLWQAAVDGSSRNLFRAKTDGNSHLWTIDVGTFMTSGFNATSGVSNNAFNLVLYQTGSTDGLQAFSSQYFNVSGTSASFPSATTTYASQATLYLATSTADPGHGNVDIHARQVAVSPIELGLGLGFGIPLLLSIIVLAYLCGRRRSRRKAATQVDTMAPPGPPTSFGASSRQQQQRNQPLTEHYGPGAGATQTTSWPQEQIPALTEHYSPGGRNQAASSSHTEHAPTSAQIPMQPIAVAKYH